MLYSYYHHCKRLRQRLRSLRSVTLTRPFAGLEKGSPADRMLVLDATALVFRIHYAAEASYKYNPQKEVIAINRELFYTRFQMHLNRYIREVQPAYIVAAFDTSKPSFRQGTFASYKSQRPKVIMALVCIID